MINNQKEDWLKKQINEQELREKTKIIETTIRARQDRYDRLTPYEKNYMEKKEMKFQKRKWEFFGLNTIMLKITLLNRYPKKHQKK
jgi:hypothetical protein